MILKYKLNELSNSQFTVLVPNNRSGDRITIAMMSTSPLSFPEQVVVQGSVAVGHTGDDLAVFEYDGTGQLVTVPRTHPVLNVVVGDFSEALADFWLYIVLPGQP